MIYRPARDYNFRMGSELPTTAELGGRMGVFSTEREGVQNGECLVFQGPLRTSGRFVSGSDIQSGSERNPWIIIRERGSHSGA